MSYKGVPKKRAWAKRMIGQPCVYCGKPADTIDHVIPQSRGGKTNQLNCVPACAECNVRKGDREVLFVPVRTKNSGYRPFEEFFKSEQLP